MGIRRVLCLPKSLSFSILEQLRCLPSDRVWGSERDGDYESKLPGGVITTPGRAMKVSVTVTIAARIELFVFSGEVHFEQ